MPRASDAFLTELDLQRADHPVHECDDQPGSEIWRAGLTHPVLCRMLESAEALASLLKLDTGVVFAMLRDPVIEEAERSPFGPVAIEEEAKSERGPSTPGPGSTPGRRSVSAESTSEDDRE